MSTLTSTASTLRARHPAVWALVPGPSSPSGVSACCRPAGGAPAAAARSGSSAPAQPRRAPPSSCAGSPPPGPARAGSSTARRRDPHGPGRRRRPAADERRTGPPSPATWPTSSRASSPAAKVPGDTSCAAVGADARTMVVDYRVYARDDPPGAPGHRGRTETTVARPATLVAGARPRRTGDHTPPRRPRAETRDTAPQAAYSDFVRPRCSSPADRTP